MKKKANTEDMRKRAGEGMSKKAGRSMRKQTKAIIAGCCAAALAMAGIGVALWHPWDGGGETENAGFMETPTDVPADRYASGAAFKDSAQAASNAWSNDPALLLSSWTGFDSYWHECTEGEEAGYEETLSDGTVVSYACNEGNATWPTFEDDTLVRTGTRVGADDDWDFVAICCLTGEVGYFRIDSALKATMDASGKPLSSYDLPEYGRGYLYYLEPMVLDDLLMKYELRTSREDLIGILDNPENYWEDEFENFWNIATEDERKALVIAVQSSDRASSTLERRIGRDVLEEYGWSEYHED